MPFETSSFQEAIDKARGKVCKICWSPLITTSVSIGPYIVRCSRDISHEGFITKKIADRERAKSKSEAIEAKINLAEAMGMAQPKKSVEELLKSIGQ